MRASWVILELGNMRIFRGGLLRLTHFGRSITAGRLTYFFDVKKAINDKLYIGITESKKIDEGNFGRHNIMIFAEDMKHFKNEILEIYGKYFE